jgi:hypothetical protein
MQVRNWIMPINRKYNLGLLLQTLREELGLKNSYKVLFEYVMLEGVNDRLDCSLWCANAAFLFNLRSPNWHSFLLQPRKIKTIWSINILSIFICVAFLSGIILILGDDDLVRMFLLMLCQHADHILRNILSMIPDLWVLHAN